ncbi:MULTISPECIES: ATP-binding cassette domain-containing protein [unclassified Clostridium]|uniref:iron ABC transporter ATP-binding protein n=1 Tax=unclassified Clostridium TaxID=2614128 RepID=UPI0013F036DE|nr:MULTISPECIES: ATP-binding cassette domain-containing protein [unclassified Clostridium]NFR87679.1 ATP-binding cassette domain-containing protein [Clostridium botulinum]NFR91530.1 ATP-binding cassette domain-containing protein [Clostridium botulinum]NFS30205.1 ATP-binding cassette domain-containing protein [Clostridium botulinum]NFS54812.1 ATP-binding cassette domain-containing protein [Clostridium botulinum]NFT18732.1 ATP-binding cassette domain-containing protein [Clostridium botulinum]
MITVKNITKKYGEKKVVDNVSLDLHENQIISFIGPNGAGKSTLLSMISRLTKKDNGEVVIDDKELSTWQDKDLSKTISILKQNNNINIRITVKELVTFGRFPYCGGNLRSEDKAFVDEAINYMELTDLQDRYLDELSGGQRQRAYIAMVIAQDTKYILLDEPLNNLDMKHSVEIMKILKRLVNEKSKTVIIVIHDINFASCYSDYIVALKNGKVVNQGKTSEIIKKDILESIYEMNFNVTNIDNRPICVYF